MYIIVRIWEIKIIYGNVVWKIVSGGYYGVKYRLLFYIEILLWLLEFMIGKGKDDNKCNKKIVIWDVVYLMKDM